MPQLDERTVTGCGRVPATLHIWATRRPDPDDPAWSWPRNLLPICHWGCGIYSCVDCSADDAPVVRFDPNVFAGDWSAWFAPERESLAQWLQAWLAGDEMFESGAVPEPAGY